MEGEPHETAQKYGAAERLAVYSLSKNGAF